MRRLRVLVLVHAELVPPEDLTGYSEKDVQPWRSEYDVTAALRDRGHHVRVLGLSDELRPIRETVDSWNPHIVFNLLIEFQDVAAYQVHVASYLEILGIPYTGCNPRGLLIARDKALSKKIFRYHRIPTPEFIVVRRGRRPRRPPGLGFPLMVKSSEEEAALGLAQASVVRDDEHLRERVEFVHRNVGTDALVEQYVVGRELTVGVIGNERLQTFPVWEMFFGNLPEGRLPIATAKVKWDLAYQKQVGIRTGPARLPADTAERIARVAKRVYRALELSGFARLDLRLSEEGRLYVLEANAIPELACDEDFALSAEKTGIEYEDLIERIVRLGLAYRRPWEER